jgi:hypothetical protein
MNGSLFKPTVDPSRLAAIARQAFRTINQRLSPLEIDANLSVLVLVVHETAVRSTDDPTLLFTLYEQAVVIASSSTPFPAASAQIAREMFLPQFAGLQTSVQRQFPLKTDVAWFDWFWLLFGSLRPDQLESEAGFLLRNDVVSDLSALGAATALTALTTMALLPEDPVVRSTIEHLFTPVKARRRADGGHTVFQTLLCLLGKIGNDAAIGTSVLFKQIVARLFFLALRERRLAQLIPAFVPFKSTDVCSQQFARIGQAMTNASFLDGFRAAAVALFDQLDRYSNDETSLTVPSDLSLDSERNQDTFLLQGPLPLVVYPEWHSFKEIWDAYARVIPDIFELRERLEAVKGRLISFADTLIDDLQTRASRAIKAEGEVWPLPGDLLGGLATVFPQVRFQYRTAGSASIARLGFIQRSGGMVIVEPAIDPTTWIGPTDLLEVVTILYALAVLHDLLVPVHQVVSSVDLVERYARRGDVRLADRTRTHPEGHTIVRVRRRVVRDEPLRVADSPPISRRRIVMELEGDDPRSCVANRAFWRRVNRAGEPLAMTRRQFERWEAFHAATGLCPLPASVVDWTLDHRPIGVTWHPQSRAYAHGVLPGTPTTTSRQFVLVGDTAVAQLTQLLLAD